MKQLLRDLCPPLLWRALERLRHGRRHEPARMFNGVYARFDQVPDEAPWAKPGYLDESRAQLQACRAGRLQPSAVTTHAVLALLIGTVPPARTPRILDWAGGTGLRFWTTRTILNRRVHWHVVDAPALAAIGHEVMGPSDELMFSAEMPSPESAFDIALVYSSLQYVEQQETILAALAGYRPRYIVFARFMGLRDDDYVTRQQLLGFNTPCKVASIRKITGALAAWQYEPVLTMRDGLDLAPMFDSDVPPDRRVGQEWLLVYHRQS